MILLFWLVLILPVCGSIISYFGKKPIIGSWINCTVTFLSFVSTLFFAIVFWRQQIPAYLFCYKQFYLDAFSLLLLLLVSFISFTTAWFSRPYMLQNILDRRITPRRLQLYHALYQAFIFTLYLTLLANNLGIMWVAMEGATLTTVLLVSLYRSPESIEAAWKYFILCIVGIALALFGTVLIYFAAQVTEVGGNGALLWSEIVNHAKTLNPAIVTIAFVFLFVGYGTKIGLVPFHNWLPDAHSESPGPMSTLLSGLLLNIALYCLLRFKIITDIALQNHLTAIFCVGFGLLSFLFASFALCKQQNLKRLFSYSSIEHMGLLTLAFGLNAKLAIIGALFYLCMHALIKSAVFTTVGNVIHLMHTQSIAKIRGLIQLQPTLGWTLLLAVLALAALPPFGIFTGELLVILAAIQIYPLLALFIIIGSVTALAGLLRHIQPMLFGAPTTTILANPQMSMVAPILHLTLAAFSGIYLMPFFYQWLERAAVIISTTAQ